MIVSMTGFGKTESQFNAKKINIEIRSLNSKNIDLNFRLPHAYRELEPLLRKQLNQELKRGKIDVSIFIDHSGAETSTRLNTGVIEQYVEQLHTIEPAERLELLKMAVRLPDALKTEKEALSEEEKNHLFDHFSQTLTQINMHRHQEGKALNDDFLFRIGQLRQLLEKVIVVEPERKEKVTEKLKEGVSKLTIDIDQNRFEQELIYYIEKYDITEEIVRLKNHLDYFEQIQGGTEPVGKKLGFIAQEIGREINTIGSKANHAELQKIVVQMKDELEKIKEQLLNVL